MKRALFAGAALLLAVSPAAFADSKSTAAGTPPPAASTPPAEVTSTGTTAGAAAAADRSVIVPPPTTTEATPKADGTKPSMAATDPTQPAPAETVAIPATGGMFTTVVAKDDLSSSVIGLDIYNGAKQDIGTIKDIAFGPAGVTAYIVGVGGFLGMGDHYVAVRPSAVALTYDNGDKKWHAMMDTNATDLKAAPEFKYPG
jgi:hypothetical protein